MDLTRDPAQQLCARLAEAGGRSGNVGLRRALGWTARAYADVRARLVAAGTLIPYRAHGGGVALAGALPPGWLTEQALYEPLAKTLAGVWAVAHGFAAPEPNGPLLVEITAAQGGRATGGAWTRPDIVLAAVRTFPYVPGKFFDLVTFEVKPAWSHDVTCVYEALSHRRCATQSYVWLHTPKSSDPQTILPLPPLAGEGCGRLASVSELSGGWVGAGPSPSARDNCKRDAPIAFLRRDGVRDARDVALGAILTEAERHGIGVIAATAPDDYATWQTLVRAKRVQPQPDELNSFIELQLSASAKERLARWMR